MPSREILLLGLDRNIVELGEIDDDHRGDIRD
jgi:hypothetical protein